MPIYLTIKYISRSIIQQDTPPATVSTPSIYISRSISQQDTPPATVSTPSINIYIYIYLDLSVSRILLLLQYLLHLTTRLERK